MELNFKVFGDGAPIVILHGLFGMLDNWQSFAKKLSDTYSVYIIDQRNHGRSPHTDEFNYELLSDDLKNWCVAEGINQAHFIGHSMGGKTVMQFAHNYPEHCKSISIIDIAPVQYAPGHLEIFDAIFTLDLTSIANRKEADFELSKKISDWGVRQFLLKNLSRSSEGFSWKANFQSLYNNYKTIIDGNHFDHLIDVPVLFVRGTKSNYIEDTHEEYIGKVFTNYQLHDIDSGHWIHAEAPEELLSHINNYLNEG